MSEQSRLATALWVRRVTEIRRAILRPFSENRMSLGANFLIAHGYTGQTTETIPFQLAPCPIECVAGEPIEVLRQSQLDVLFQEMKSPRCTVFLSGYSR